MPDFGRETELWRQGYRHVAGVDEAGRGPLAGPVVVAAVILPPGWPAELVLDDSKRLTPERRERLFDGVRRHALAWRVRVMAPALIDRVNILQATLQGMAEAVARLRPAADYVLVDGNRLPALAPPTPAEAIVKGDGRCCSIAAASILAKVVRDRLMAVYGRRYPEWGFAAHKGYGTAAHLEALQRCGPSPIHRRSFRVRDARWQAGPRTDGPLTDGPRSEGRENLSLPGIWSD
jgi:ribonuclease HII